MHNNELKIMSKKYIWIAMIAILIIAGTWYFMRSPKARKEETGAQTKEENKQLEKNTVSYTKDGFTPNPLKIKVGETVIFKNDDPAPIRVASDVHPTHIAYPTTGGCVGSTFDSCANIDTGKSWSFKFDFKGSRKYHNHLNPSDTGTIIVE